MGKKKRSRAEEKRAQARAAEPVTDERVTVQALDAALAVPPAPGPRRWPLELAAWAALGLVCAFFLTLKAYSLRWEVGDENIYLYMAWAFGDHGAWPYRDYFFAHPPLHLAPGMLLYSFAEVTPFTARLIPVAATLGSAVFVFLAARRRAGRLAAVLAAGLFLMAFDLLRASSHWTGINLSVLWLTAGLWALLGRRTLLAGVFFALGVCTGTYVLPGALMALALALLLSFRAGLRFLLGFGAPWLVLQIAAGVLGGADYWQAVYGYHLAKPAKEGVSRDMIARVLTDNFALALGGLLGPLVAWLEGRLGAWLGQGRQARPALARAGFLALGWAWLRRALWEDAGGLARVGALWAFGYLLFILMLPRVFPFYFLLMFPALALAGGFAWARWLAWLLGLTRQARARGPGWLRAAGVLVGLAGAVLAAYAARVPVQRALLPGYVRASDVPMRWHDAQLPSWLNAALRACCWEDVARARAEYGTLTEVLFHESRSFEAAEELAAHVRAHSRPDETLFGDSSSAGLVALLSGRRLQADFADTNTLRFSSGVASAEDTIRLVDRPSLRFVLVSGSLGKGSDGQPVPRYGMFASLPAFRRWLEDGWQVARVVRDRTKGTFFLLERKSRAGSS
jgi:hypothetical protein